MRIHPETHVGLFALAPCRLGAAMYALPHFHSHARAVKPGPTSDSNRSTRFCADTSRRIIVRSEPVRSSDHLERLARILADWPWPRRSEPGPVSVSYALGMSVAPLRRFHPVVWITPWHGGSQSCFYLVEPGLTRRTSLKTLIGR